MFSLDERVQNMRASIREAGKEAEARKKAMIAEKQKELLPYTQELRRFVNELNKSSEYLSVFGEECKVFEREGVTYASTEGKLYTFADNFRTSQHMDIQLEKLGEKEFGEVKALVRFYSGDPSIPVDSWVGEDEYETTVTSPSRLRDELVEVVAGYIARTTAYNFYKG